MHKKIIRACRQKLSVLTLNCCASSPITMKRNFLTETSNTSANEVPNICNQHDHKSSHHQTEREEFVHPVDIASHKSENCEAELEIQDTAF